MSQENNKPVIQRYDLRIAKHIGINAAVVYGFIYDSIKNANIEWIALNYAQMIDATSLKEDQLRSAYKKLIDNKYIEYKISKQCGGPTCNFKVNL